jgi:hypothetical protein
LCGGDLTEKRVQQICKLDRLTRLVLVNAKISKAGREILAAAMPHTEIFCAPEPTVKAVTEGQGP